MNNNQEQEEIEESGGEHTTHQDDEDNYVYEICQLFDKDNDETIYMKDILDLVKALGIVLDKENKTILNNFIEKLTEEKISFDEFFQLYDLLNQRKKSKEEEINELLKAFQFFDGEGSGFIEINYLKKAITSFGDKISEEDFNNIIEKVITDNTGKKLDYRDLINIILELKK